MFPHRKTNVFDIQKDSGVFLMGNDLLSMGVTHENVIQHYSLIKSGCKIIIMCS